MIETIYPTGDMAAVARRFTMAGALKVARRLTARLTDRERADGRATYTPVRLHAPFPRHAKHLRASVYADA